MNRKAQKFINCPSCGKKKAKKIVGNFNLTKSTTIPNIEYYICLNCDEKLTDAKNEEKIEQYIRNISIKIKKAA